jgi:translation initiation factor 1
MPGFEQLSSEGLPPGPDLPASKLGRVVLRREKAHRGGKTVIVVHDFPSHITLPAIEALATKLKKACGTGGTVKDRTIEIQGDQPGRIRALLEGEGFRVAGV